eukprot:SAG31_NODE_3399_length_4314_cov_6.223962_2_plen_605_part_00
MAWKQAAQYDQEGTTNHDDEKCLAAVLSYLEGIEWARAAQQSPAVAEKVKMGLAKKLTDIQRRVDMLSDKVGQQIVEDSWEARCQQVLVRIGTSSIDRQSEAAVSAPTSAPVPPGSSEHSRLSPKQADAPAPAHVQTSGTKSSSSDFPPAVVAASTTLKKMPPVPISDDLPAPATNVTQTSNPGEGGVRHHSEAGSPVGYATGALGEHGGLREDISVVPRQEGLLKKKSPTAGKGWQERWFVLENRVLSYFKQRDAKSMFMEADKDNSGSLDTKEVGRLCKDMGMKLNKKAEQRMMEELDSNRDNQVTFEEFEAWWRVNGGKTAKARQEVGSIQLSEIRDIQAVGTLGITVVGSDRNYNLEASTEVEAEVWVTKMRQSLPSPQDQAANNSTLRRAAWFETMDRLLSVNGQIPPLTVAAFPAEGPLGIMWQELRYERFCFAVVKAVQPGSAAAMNQVVAGLLLGYIQGQSTFGQQYEDVISHIKQASRPLQIGFIAEIEPEMPPPQTETASDPDCPVLAKGWLFLGWDGGKKKKKPERYFCTVDKVRMAWFKVADDVVIDKSNELISVSKAAGTLVMQMATLLPVTGVNLIKMQRMGGTFCLYAF